MSGGPVVSIRGLRKTYGAVDAVAGIDLEIERGEIFAFLGPNGAGKTTTVEILEGFRDRTAGEVSVLGVDPQHADAAWRNRVGSVLQESSAEPGFTVRECLQLYAGYYLAPRDIDETIALVGLEEKAETRGAQLSGGQRRRLDVALALIGDPELIFLDEPTTGFDPSARRTAWHVIEGLRELGKTVFLTTHYMDEAEHLADRIAVIAGGRIVAEGTPGSLGGRDAMAATISFTLPAEVSTDELPEELRGILAGDGGKTTLTTHTPLVHVRALADWAIGRGLDLPDLAVRRPTLEDVYLELTEALAMTTPAARGPFFLVLHQSRYELIGILRNRQARFFTIALPVIFLFIFVGIFGNHVVPPGVKLSTTYVPGLSALGVISSSFINLVISITVQREEGILKRRRASPVPAWVLIVGRTFTAVCMSLAVVAVLMTIGRVVFGVDLRLAALPGIAVTVVAGSITFCVLGYAFSTVIHSEDAAQPMVQATMLPLYFISGIFISNDTIPHWLQRVALVFPVAHLADGLRNAYNPLATGVGIVWIDIGVMALWAVGGLAIAIWRFSWVPSATS